MHDKVETLYELCETISRELDECNEKIRQAGGKLSAGDVDYIDKLTHALKSIKTTVAMMEAEGDGYSGRYYPMYGGSYNDGRSYRGGSYARGRMNARRDSMGRYSGERGYSRADGLEEMLGEMRDMMGDLPEEKRREVQRFVEKMERM